MVQSIYFLRRLATLFFVVFAAISSFSQEEEEILLEETILNAGEELSLPVDCDRFVQVDFTAVNMVDGNASFWQTMLYQGEELPENEIGPVKFRTHQLGAQDSENDTTIITLDCSDFDELLFHVTKGKVQITVIGRTTY